MYYYAICNDVGYVTISRGFSVYTDMFDEYVQTCGAAINLKDYMWRVTGTAHDVMAAMQQHMVNVEGE